MKQPVQPGAAGHTAPEGSSRSRSCWHGVSLWREARKRLRTWVEEVACAPAVSGCVLLDAAAYLTWGVASELDDMEGFQDAGGVLELIVDGVLSVPGRGPAPWDDPSLEWSTMPVSSRGPRRRRSWWCHTCSSTPSTRTPAKRAGSSDAACRHGLMWDHTVFHVVASCRANPAMMAPSKRNCRIAQRIARTMSTTESHTEGLSTDISRRLAPERTSALHGASSRRL